MILTALSGIIYHISKISYAAGSYAEPVLPEKIRFGLANGSPLYDLDKNLHGHAR